MARVDAAKSLNRSALALHANTVITAGLGYAFLVIASHLFDEARLGQDLALVSAMMLLASVSELNLGLALPKFLPRMGKRSPSTVAKAYAVSSFVAVCLAALFVIVAPQVAGSLQFLGDSTSLAIVFVAAVVLWNVFALQDGVLVALRKASWVPIENGIFGIAKIVLMVWWATTNLEHGVFYAWAIPMALMVIPMTGLLFTRALPPHVVATRDCRDAGEVFTRRALARYLGLDYLASLLMQLSSTILPVMVLVVLGAELNAIFGIAFTIVTAVEQLSLNAGMSLLVEGAIDRKALPGLLRHTFKRFAVLLVAVVGIVCLLAPLALLPFPDPYPETVPTVLRLMVIGLIPQALVVLFQATQRVRGNAGRVVLSTFGQMATILTLVVVLAMHYGLAGVGWGWIIGNSIVALLVLPSLVSTARSSS